MNRHAASNLLRIALFCLGAEASTDIVYRLQSGVNTFLVGEAYCGKSPWPDSRRAVLAGAIAFFVVEKINESATAKMVQVADRVDVPEN